MKRDGQTLYKKPYTKSTLLDMIIQMHLDFKQVMESTALSNKKSPSEPPEGHN